MTNYNDNDKKNKHDSKPQNEERGIKRPTSPGEKVPDKLPKKGNK